MHGVTKAKREELQAAKETLLKVNQFNDLIKKYDELKSSTNYSELLTTNTNILYIAPQNYQYWNERKRFIIQLQEDDTCDVDALLQNELDLVVKLLPSNSKCYAIWHHRRWIIERMNNVNWELEMKLCSKMIGADSRNFHCWGYYLYVLDKGEITVEKDFEFTTQQINKNFSNYSAWHHRSVIFSTYDTETLISLLSKEFDLLLNAFYIEPNDQSAWIYYRWLLATCIKTYTTANKIEECITLLKSQFKQIQELNDIEPNCKWVLFTLLEINDSIRMIDSTIRLLNEEVVKKYIGQLENIDVMRKGYYSFFQRTTEIEQ
ncbi:Geranylgeranyl transferase type-2 subunit alpha [Entamoeba marina]